jgi:hypothetical protein
VCVGIDWSDRRAAWCSLGEAGAIVGEGAVGADEDGLAGLVSKGGAEARAVVEMLSGAIWVRDTLAAAGWDVQIARARTVGDVAPLACMTDKGRRARAGRVVAPRSRARVVGGAACGSRAARAAAAPAAPGWDARVGDAPHRRVADAVGAAAVVAAAARARRRGRARAPRRARGLAALDRRGAGRDRPARRADRPGSTPGSAPWRAPTPAWRCWTRSPASVTCSRSRSRRRSVTSPASADRARRSATPAWPRASIGPATAHAPARSRRRRTGAALGRRRGRPPRLAPDQPRPSARRRSRHARRQEPRQVRRRAHDP